jgi:ABC-type transport system involved in cytochrome c biogenesis permease subunit
MMIKYTIQGWLIYATMLAYLAAGVGLMFRKPLLRWGGWAAYVAGFVLACVSLAWRAHETQHIPLANVFDVMLVVAAAMPLMTWLGWQLGAAAAPGADAFVAVIVLFPLGFVFDQVPSPPSPLLRSPLFVPHVLAYMLSYAILTKAAVQAIAELIAGHNQRAGRFEPGARRLVVTAFPLLTAGLLLGAWWGKLAWTRHWGWDPKELWSLAGWLVVLVYLHRPRWTPRAGALFVVIIMELIVITLLCVNFASTFSGLHSYAT